MISYCTEKTTEYSLVPAFSDILNKLGENTPITYWKTREGNRTSRNVNNAGEVYLLAFFPRRPKVDPKKDYHIQGKINTYIFEFNSLAKKHSIAVFCGIPLARNIYELKKSEKNMVLYPREFTKGIRGHI
ncbi:hypothetical protein [Pectobacterium brasiliense]|uniref:hypothetical protein n=1 Tax=Pectobacterium brasiliense TaxID=180957 RepID=UPI0018E0BD01|nr:hypothetical protein [Pectobacterium brasiliense]MCA6982849.1 hypothetical protein [Pectobacterium brasiliense]